jgi:polyphosphate kinase
MADTQRTESRQELQPQFFNRELSWIEFNRRVLAEGLDQSNPLLERLRFLSIVSSNFDEFFMVRVAGLKRQLAEGNFTPDVAGMSPREQLRAISERVREVTEAKYDCLLNDILPKLEDEGLVFRRPQDLSGAQKKYLREVFEREIFPVLTPVRQDQETDPIPYSGNMRLHAAFLLEPDPDAEPRLLDEIDGSEAGSHLAVVQLPPSLDRIIYVPDSDVVIFTLLEFVVQMYADHLFPGYRIVEDAMFRVVRDADMSVNEERDEDFVEAMEQVLEHRQTSQAVRLSINKGEGRLAEILREGLALEEDEVYQKPDPLDLGSLVGLAGLDGFEHLRNHRWAPLPNRHFADDDEVWDVLKRRDVLLHHPYESVDPVIEMLQQAARDPSVLAIKMTLYRTSGDSPIVYALEEAAENGKQVMALVELKARFDERRNIEWAERLQRAGAIVVYGIARLKVHAKALMVIRRETRGIQRYVHMGTGNYNDRTAKLYGDFGLMTSRDELAYEVGLFFNAVTGYSAIPALNKLAMAPMGLKPRIIQLIEREAMRSSAEEPGFIMVKINSLADPDVITALYKASGQGVRIELNVRGICMLVPGVPGMSENISVVSIVDRFLEHARAFVFHNGGNEEVYLSSADWMPRNLERRVELLFPVEEPDLKREVKNVLRAYFDDNVKAHELQSDGSFRRKTPGPGEKPLRAQEYLYTQTRAIADTAEPANRKEFDVRREPGDGGGSA